ncbi:MAG: GGDEF domain-containing protein [Anaerolineales bacterium]|nr:GGDEF domain-containing protein [Anaerolineales bacterium]
MIKLAEIITTQDVETIFDAIHAMVALVESDGRLVSWNSAFESCKKTIPSAVNLNELFSPNDKSLLHGKLSNRLLNHWAVEFPLNGAGPSKYCDCMFIPIDDERVLFIAERMESDIALQEMIERLDRRVKLFQIESEFSKKIARNKQIEMDAVMVQASEVAHVDPLTFLVNRRTIIRELQDEVMRAERYQSMLSVSVVDVDNFKAVNDTFGHPVGDEVLRQVAHQLRESIRHPDTVGRYGGEEFLIILPNSNSAAASEQAARLCKQVRETVVRVKEHEVNITLSVGVAQFRVGVDTWDTLLNHADNAMYEAKRNGRDRWHIAK